MLEVPVYAFLGFLDSGKSTFIEEVLTNPSFTQQEHTLLLLCEQGTHAFSPSLLAQSHTTAIVVDDIAMLTPAYYEALAQQYQPDRAIIEYNGMWDVAQLSAQLPESWPLYQVVATVDAGTWALYSQNMGAQMFAHLTHADMIVFNRADAPQKEQIRAKNIRAMNPRANIYFEDTQGQAEDYLDGTTLPYDIDAPIISIADTDFGIFYVDAMNDPDKYAGKTIQLTGMVYHPSNCPPNAFVLGRRAMVCCADDITLLGLHCHTPLSDTVSQEQWVCVTATVQSEYYPQFRAHGPSLHASAVTLTAAAEPEMVYFN